MKTCLSSSQLEACKQFYLQTLNVDERGLALDADSLNIVSILVSVAELLKLDLYDLIDNFEEDSFASVESFTARLESVVAQLERLRETGSDSKD